MDLRNFNRFEFECDCCGEAPMSKVFLERLQILRDMYGSPLSINSGYRCPAHNKNVGGSSKSRHMQGDAVDISIVNMSGAQKHKLLSLITQLEFGGIGIAKGFIHIDLRDKPTIWTY